VDPSGHKKVPPEGFPIAVIVADEPEQIVGLFTETEGV
jgi:hypothetical protein